MNKKIYVIGAMLLLIAALVFAGSGKIIADILTVSDLTATGTVDVALAGSNITSGTVADARIASTIARDSEVSSAILINNNTMKAYVDAASGADINKTYSDAQDAAVNASARSYADAQDVIYNLSSKVYADSIVTVNKTYVDVQDIGNQTFQGFINFTSGIETIGYFTPGCIIKQNDSGIYFIC